MTPEEEHAIQLFIKIVSEFNDAQEGVDKLEGNVVGSEIQIVRWINGFLDSLRCDESQEDLNQLAVSLVGQEEL